MDEDLAVCDRAMVLAGQLRDPALIAETQTIQGYLRMIKAMHLIAAGAAGKKELDEAGRKSVQAALDELDSASQQANDGLRMWNKAVAPDCDLEKTGRGPAGVTEQTVADVAKGLAPLGIQRKGMARE